MYLAFVLAPAPTTIILGTNIIYSIYIVLIVEEVVMMEIEAFCWSFQDKPEYLYHNVHYLKTDGGYFGIDRQMSQSFLSYRCVFPFSWRWVCILH
jgi:hypothetical protein